MSFGGFGHRSQIERFGSTRKEELRQGETITYPGLMIYHNDTVV